MIPNNPLGAGLATEPSAAALPGGPTSGIPMFSGPFSASQPSSFSTLQPSSSSTSDEEKQEEDTHLEDSFLEIFGRPPELSLYDLPLPDLMINELISTLKTEDLSPFLSCAPPPFVRTASPFKDALDQAGERCETFLYPVMKLLLFAHSKTQKDDAAHEPIAQACLLLAQALKEARNARIQARFGFSEAAKIKEDSASTLLTKRQRDLLEESRKTIESTSKRWAQISFNSKAFGKRYYGKDRTSQRDQHLQFFRSGPRSYAGRRSASTYNKSPSQQRSRGARTN
ncbi:uncharacterized protein MONOS_10358 [Monocercomonoides exilis]|uniref:uncharacterized protein n=1 Tax=Monocercomonoides exilis TaxID=2049356 RepID=UPI00355A8334|nr:hypothetical protein MONOS_10358 [Monocercomonoides exilis]|eukprot:MONOS_10358.1-p1 / transcript=MONOS_10358.1 / gene=MONOS_10358 / organism=Monocercomonoides_exilis_PA203 / gene_product=unspecified product / transcript_product=unspecified product / location=Mono_scaffold00467:44061-44912(+) / protein_length=284 / sequence_SO=supercontig / SO=protein_coding / is_pseudo=false